MSQIRWFHVCILFSGSSRTFFSVQRCSTRVLYAQFVQNLIYSSGAGTANIYQLIRLFSLRKHKPEATKKTGIDGEALLIKITVFVFSVHVQFDANSSILTSTQCLSQIHRFLQTFSLFFFSFENSLSSSYARCACRSAVGSLSLTNVKYWLKTDYYYYCCFVRFQFSKHRDAPLT